MRYNIFLILSIFLLLLIATGCKKTCGDCVHGSCSGPVCACPDPWSGVNCDTQCAPGLEGYGCLTLSRTHFTGTWSCTATDPSNNKTNFLITFADHPVVPEWMFMNNFLNNGSQVICILTGKFQFQVQDTSHVGATVYIDGFANYNNGTMTMYMNVNGIQYFTTAVKQ